MFYLILLQNFNDGSATAKAIFEYTTYEEALSTLYSTMASGIATQTIQAVTCRLVDDKLNPVKYDRWERIESV